MRNCPALSFAILMTATSLQAWGPHGHMMVAAVAWNHLTPPVRAEVGRLLKLNPQYDTWINGVDPKRADEFAFIVAATWPDFIKSADGYTNDGEHPTSPDAARNIGYADEMQHRYWHFYDTPLKADLTPTKSPDMVNALTQILMFTRALQKSRDDAVLSYDLVWLEHMVGDVHQPLHATSRFDVDDPLGDQGGNRVRLCPSSHGAAQARSCTLKLHAFWDDIPGAQRDPATAITDAASLPSPDATNANDLNPQHWIDESFALARTDVYIGPIDLGDGPYVITAGYKANALHVAQGQIALAGLRLANLLNGHIVTSQ